MPSESKYERQKVSQNRLSALMKFIVLSVDGGIERGEIVEKYYRLERRYCGHYVENCLRGKQKKLYDRRYRAAQSAISKALGRLANQGLVRLIRYGQYVKQACLTEEGARMAKKLRRVGDDSNNCK